MSVPSSRFSSSGPDNGRRRTRGPRNRRPVLLRITAIFHLLARLLFLGAIVGVPITLIQHRDIRMVAILPALLLPVGLLWLFLATKIGCRVCAMRMFFSRKCVKSPKAPSWPLIGPHNTLAFLALFSSSVRCPYCGTPNELSSGSPEDD